jgi:hypothetical protein
MKSSEASERELWQNETMKLPQLSLRDLFWLVLVVGIVSAWGLDHQWATGQIEKLTKQIFPFVPPAERIILHGYEERLPLNIQAPWADAHQPRFSRRRK